MSHLLGLTEIAGWRTFQQYHRRSLHHLQGWTGGHLLQAFKLLFEVLVPKQKGGLDWGLIDWDFNKRCLYFQMRADKMAEI